MSIVMARPTTSGLPYLVRRAECGRFYYCRTFQGDLVPHISGVISIPFARRTLALNRHRMVKISLKTGDEDTARDRWAHVHAEVRRVVEDATRSHADSLADREQPFERRVRLSAAERQAIADQVRHDILAQDDREQIDPDAASPLRGSLPESLMMAARLRSKTRWSADVVMRGSLNTTRGSCSFHADRVGFPHLRRGHPGATEAAALPAHRGLSR